MKFICCGLEETSSQQSQTLDFVLDLHKCLEFFVDSTSYLLVTTLYKETYEFTRISAAAPINFFL